MTKPPLERVTITIPQPLLAAADDLAVRLDRSRSWVLAEAVRRMVAAEPSPNPSPVPVAPVESAARPPRSKPPASTALEQRLARAVALPPAARLRSAEERSHPSHLVEIARGLQQTESRYLVIGMVAETLHGHFHPIRRVELFMKRTLENAVRVLAGLEATGYASAADLLPEHLLDQPSALISGVPGIVCYSTIPGIRYDQVEERADQFVLGGTRVPVMAIADLITLRSEGPLANDEDHAVLQQLQDLTRREPS
jgi:hypothetical protein